MVCGVLAVSRRCLGRRPSHGSVGVRACDQARPPRWCPGRCPGRGPGGLPACVSVSVIARAVGVLKARLGLRAALSFPKPRLVGALDKHLPRLGTPKNGFTEVAEGVANSVAHLDDARLVTGRLRVPPRNLELARKLLPRRAAEAVRKDQNHTPTQVLSAARASGSRRDTQEGVKHTGGEAKNGLRRIGPSLPARFVCFLVCALPNRRSENRIQISTKATPRSCFCYVFTRRPPIRKLQNCDLAPS